MRIIGLMDMKVSFLVFFLFVSSAIFGNTSYILFDKLPASQNNDKHLNFLKVNEKYFKHSSPQWEYSVSKATLVTGLKEALNFYAGLDASNLENNLLMGEIALYLFNLNESTYRETAEKCFKKASQLAPLDYRPYWFLGNFYAAANDQTHSIEFFKIAQNRLPLPEPAPYWEQYANAAKMASMPSTCIYAMDRAKSILGRPCDFEKNFGQAVRNKIAEISSSRTYTNTELWSYTEGVVITFTSRALGLNVTIDPEWELQLSGFDKMKATFTIIPPALISTKGQEIPYTMSIITKVTTEGEDLKTFLNTLVPSKLVKTEIEFSQKYPNTISYELIDSTTNADKGGNHIYLIGFRRKQPLYPGMLLEEPLQVSNTESGETDFLKAQNVKNRFPGTLFYTAILEASEDIFPLARRVFWDLFVNQMVVE